MHCGNAVVDSFNQKAHFIPSKLMCFTFKCKMQIYTCSETAGFSVMFHQELLFNLKRELNYVLKLSVEI